MARLCSRPVREQAARWSPWRSSLHPQRRPGQRLAPSKSGSRRRRRSATWNSAGRSVVDGDAGSAASQVPAPEPEAERISARCPRDRRGNNARSLKRVSRVEQALNCHPCRHSPGSAALTPSSSASSAAVCCGRAPARRAAHEGRPVQPSSSRRSPAAAASCRQDEPCLEESSSVSRKVLAQPALRLCSISRQSAHAAQYAAGAVLVALLRPQPPLRTGKVATCHAALWRPKGRGCSRSLLRHSLTWSSCPAAYSLDALGGSILSKWFALGTAVCNRSAQAHCRSGSVGNTSSRSCSSSRRFCTCVAT